MIILLLLIPGLLGLAVCAALWRLRAVYFGWGEKLALAFIIGWGVHTIVMFLISLAGAPLTLATITMADLVIAAALLAYAYRKSGWTGWRPAAWNLPSLGGLALLLLIALKLFLVVWGAFLKPVLDPDIISCYALGAKMIFLQKTVLVNGPWGDKPLMPFLSQAWTAIGLNTWNDTLLTLPNPLFYVSFLVIFYAALARYFKRWYALLATTLLATIPFLAYQAGTAYSDFAQALYYTLATIYLFLFVKEFKNNGEASAGYLMTGALLLGLSVWAKRSGLYYAAIDAAAVAAFIWTVRSALGKEDWQGLARSALLLIATAAPWLLFNQLSTFRGYYVAPATLSPALPFNVTPRSWPVIAALFRNAFFEDNWHCLGLLAVAALAFYPRQALDQRRGFLSLVIALQLICLFVLFRFTGNYKYIATETLLNRLTFHFVPLILYYCAEVIGAGAAGARPAPEEKQG